MNGSLVMRRGLAWTIAVLTILIVVPAGLVAAIDTGHCRGLLIRYFASRMGRPIQVNGAFQAHLFTLKPRVIAERVVIGNPPWMPSGITAEVGKLSVVLKLPGLGHPSGIVGLDMQAATFYLARDSSGRANWQLTDPTKSSVDENLPIVRSLSMSNAHVLLEDALRHLRFDGTISAEDLSEPGAVQPLRIEGTGQLNGKTVGFAVTADPLAAASHKIPYHFIFTERSSGSRLDGQGFLPRPFDFEILDATFGAAGPDLKDLYFLIGVSLIDTGSYHLAGKLSRQGTNTKLSDLIATFGQSDVHGTVSMESWGERTKLDLNLNSQTLRLSDFGLRAAGRTSEPESPLLLSDSTVSTDMVRRDDAVLHFRAHRVDVGRLPLHEVSAKATIDHGVLTVAPLLAEVLGGTVNVQLRLDASKAVPAADVDLKIADLQLGQIGHKGAGPPSIEGAMQARVTVTGAGSSVHQVAASANGTVWAKVSHGAIRDSFAELTGVDLRGLGLLLTKNKQEIPVRCAIANFKAYEGTLISQTLVVDTDPILITGEGQIHLDTEALDLTFRGHPKSLRLFRLRTPVLVRGTLAHPAIDIAESKSALVIVDAGRAKDADCAALLAAANSDGAWVKKMP